MNSRMRRKASLLSRVSTLAVLAAAGTLSVVQQAQAACDTTFEVPADGTTIATNTTCVEVTADVAGNVLNDAQVGDPGAGFIPFDVYNDIIGTLTNDGNIFGGYGQDGALTIRQGATITNGIVNNGVILSTTGNGIQIGDGGENEGYVQNGITNTNNIASGGGYGVAALYGSLTGGLTNQFDEQASTISGGPAAIYIADTFDSWSGGIVNYGQISGTQSAILMGDGGEGAGDVTFSGGIFNYGTGVIDSVNGPAIRITNDVATFSGGINNYNDIEGGTDAIIIGAGSFAGGLYNDTFATIVANSGDAVQAQVNSWTGDINNQGVVTATNDAFEIFGGEGSTFTGNIVNAGQINAGSSGILLAMSNFEGDITNSGTITAEEGRGISISVSDLVGSGGEVPSQITNTGSIIADDTGVYIFGSTVTADFTNTSAGPLEPFGEITSANNAALVLAANTLWEGDITNDGTLSGRAGAIVNATFISDGFFSSTTGSFEGTITNNGLIEGDLFGLVVAGDGFTGELVNTGEIVATSSEAFSVAGLIVSVDSWSGNITNTSTGLIQGAVTGAYISANSFEGDIINDGVISGGAGSIGQLFFDPGLVVSVGTYTGDIINNGTLDAVTDALVVDVGTLTGSVINTGVIDATGGGRAVLLDVGNGTTFTNTDGGLVFGDIVFDDPVFGGKATYHFVGEDGGVEGRLLGKVDLSNDNDDTITVQNGTQYFYFEGKGSAINNFTSFTVEDGGTAVLGARSISDTSGSSSFIVSNVDTLTVNGGGTLFIGQGASVNVGTYTQDANGTLMYYLGAPSGISGLTGVVQAGAGDYGQVQVSGTATLSGVIAGFLDPDFGSANPDLEAVEYQDVLVADAISGDFSTLALLNSNAIWELDSIIDNNTVDLRVQRIADVGHIGGVPGIVVETAGPWKSMVNDRSNGIGSGSCGLAGDGWCFNRYAQSGPGATQVMTDASPGEDPFAWLRTGVRRVGETAVWARAVGVWGETDGDAGSSGTDFDLVGGIVGVDHVFTQTLLAGLAAQWSTTDIDFNGLPDNAEVDSLEVGAYASWGDTRLYLNTNASFIWHDIEVNRFGIGTQAQGDYDGTTISAYAEAGKIFETQSGFRIQPLVALSFAHLETDGYSETGTGTLLNVFESDFDTLKSMLGARFAYPVQLDSGRKLVPEARAVWAHEFLDDQSSFLATIQGGLPTPSLIVGEEYSRDTLIVGTGVTAPISEQTTLFVDYDAGLNDDITTHTVSAGFRTRW